MSFSRQNPSDLRISLPVPAGHMCHPFQLLWQTSTITGVTRPCVTGLSSWNFRECPFALPRGQSRSINQSVETYWFLISSPGKQASECSVRTQPEEGHESPFFLRRVPSAHIYIYVVRVSVMSACSLCPVRSGPAGLGIYIIIIKLGFVSIFLISIFFQFDSSIILIIYLSIWLGTVQYVCM